MSPAVDEATRLRAALRMQGEEDVAKFRHVLLRELSAERERLQRVLDSKVVCVGVMIRFFMLFVVTIPVQCTFWLLSLT